MQFAARLRDRIRAGEISCSIRIWHAPRVRVGNSYAMGEGRVVIDSIDRIGPDDVTDALARRSGFADAADLLGIARHGTGDHIYLVMFHYVAG